jgi:hypothetical protein
MGPVFGPNEAFASCHNVYTVFVEMMHNLQEIVEVAGKAGQVSDQNAIKGLGPFLSGIHQAPKRMASDQRSARNRDICLN